MMKTKNFSIKKQIKFNKEMNKLAMEVVRKMRQLNWKNDEKTEDIAEEELNAPKT